jgi:hypothetical protein
MRHRWITAAVLALGFACSAPVNQGNTRARDGTALTSAAAAFIQIYGATVAAARRDTLAQFYHPDGAILVVDGQRSRLTRAGLDSLYRGPWIPPIFFAWDSLTYDQLGPSQVMATGSFRWQDPGQADTSRYVYAVLLETAGDRLAIRLEHETRCRQYCSWP